MAGQLRHMLRDDDINHAEQKQILELGMKFRENRFYRQPFAGPQAVAVLFDSSRRPLTSLAYLTPKPWCCSYSIQWMRRINGQPLRMCTMQRGRADRTKTT